MASCFNAWCLGSHFCHTLGEGAGILGGPQWAQGGSGEGGHSQGHSHTGPHHTGAHTYHWTETLAYRQKDTVVVLEWWCENLQGRVDHLCYSVATLILITFKYTPLFVEIT